MKFNRTELMPGVFLSHLRSDKFKTACMSVTLLTQLRRETAAMNAVIPFVLRRGTTRYGDMEQLSRRMDELYGAAVEPVVRRIGEIQCIGFYGSFPEPDYLPGGEALLGDTCALMAQLRREPLQEIAGTKVVRMRDYQDGSVYVMGLGKMDKTPISGSNVLYFELDDGCAFIVRPSGTEPKIKVYILGVGATRPECDERVQRYAQFAETLRG